MKLLVSSFLCFLMTFTIPSFSWGATNDFSEIGTINLATQPFFETELLVPETDENIMMPDYPDYWLASAFIPGLGHILMGEIAQGATIAVFFSVLFSLALYLDINIAKGIITEITKNNPNSNTNLGPMIYLIGIGLFAAFVFANVTTVYSYILSLNSAIALNKTKKDQHLKKFQQTLEQFRKNINLNSNGLSYSVVTF